MLEKVVREYPNLSVVASTLRKVISASINDWSACVTQMEAFIAQKNMIRLRFLMG